MKNSNTLRYLIKFAFIFFCSTLVHPICLEYSKKKNLRPQDFFYLQYIPTLLRTVLFFYQCQTGQTDNRMATIIVILSSVGNEFPGKPPLGFFAVPHPQTLFQMFPVCFYQVFYFDSACSFLFDCFVKKKNGRRFFFFYKKHVSFTLVLP